ncbi:MAG: DUF2442 domain-containing protein [Polaromonas sp.]|jgi:hypothetical protein
MRIETATEENFAFGIEPCSPPVVAVTVGGELTLRVQFEDGIQGDVKFLPSHLTGVFEPLKNPSFFAKAYVEHGAVTWPGELDLAPDAMYDEVKQNGVWILQ